MTTALDLQQDRHLGIPALVVGPSGAEMWGVIGMFTALGFHLAHAADFDAAKIILEDAPPGLMLVDGRLPGVTDLCAMAAGHGVLVMLLAASDDPLEQVRALESGADDIVQRPIVPEFLAAKAWALIRRKTSFIGVGGAGVRTADWRVDMARRLARSPRGTRVPLPYQQAALFELFISQSGQVVTPEQIVGAPGLEKLTPGNVRVSVSRLRRRLQNVDTGDPIKTIHGLGYMYVAPSLAATKADAGNVTPFNPSRRRAAGRDASRPSAAQAHHS